MNSAAADASLPAESSACSLTPPPELTMDDAAVSASSTPAVHPPASPPLHIVICPWLAFGHMLPYLELAERLASRGHRVSYVSTPRNLARLPPRRHAGAGVELVALQLPRVQGLPDGAESTTDVPGDKFEQLWEAFDGLAVPFTEFLAEACAVDDDNDAGTTERPPDWVLVDTFHHWAPSVAAAHKVPCAMLQPTAAVISAWACGASEHAELAAASVFEQIPTLQVQEPPAGMPRHEWKRDAAMFSPRTASGLSVAQRVTLTLEGCTIAAMRSCPEWELQAFSHAAALLGKPLVPLGLLPPSPDGGRSAGENRDDDATVRWLDAQPPKSVVYVALGSEVPLHVDLVHELALGLELAGTRFVWALRKPSSVPDSDLLPPGFQERTHAWPLRASHHGGGFRKSAYWRMPR